MKRIGLLTLLIFNLNLVIGQVTRREAERNEVKGVVVDENNQPIPYVNIWVENENIGTTSEEDGTFTLPVSETKRICFSALGYETRIVSATNVKSVVLYPKTLALNEVVIEKRKGTQEIVIGDFSGIKLNSGVTNTGQDNVHVWAKFIRYNEKIKAHPFIESIEFVTNSKLKNALLRIRIFNVNNEGLPIGDEVEEDILVSIKKGEKNNIVDLAKYNIKIPEEGIMIGFEYLKLEQNKYEYNYIIEGEKESQKRFRYEPSIKGFYPGDKTLMILNRDGSPRSAGNGNIEIALKIKLSN
ncbi:carboxypeptidase-like regulatory domain-containing protein [Flavobacterium sp.]|uniref:carboxypeptidase-like regulatory domain-containing protein n=1 Tax=Flavobacterium sp. TaxID=239 RepID=UPI0025D820FB|nr:carboxypeptidase-like regulatory domain-containing protein [Flavobacterium sp.]